MSSTKKREFKKEVKSNVKGPRGITANDIETFQKVLEKHGEKKQNEEFNKQV